jgi:hypothetical protein
MALGERGGCYDLVVVLALLVVVASRIFYRLEQKIE